MVSSLLHRFVQAVFTFVVSGLLVSCSASKSTSILYGDDYDIRKDTTTVTIFPYGAVRIPGKWTKTHENDVSQEHFFKGPDSATFAVALNPWDQFEFSNDELTTETFVQAFYEWDAAYLKEQTRGQVAIVKQDKARNFIIWKLTKPSKAIDYFLFGLKGKIAYNLYVESTAWDEVRKVELLEKIYAE